MSNGGFKRSTRNLARQPYAQKKPITGFEAEMGSGYRRLNDYTDQRPLAFRECATTKRCGQCAGSTYAQVSPRKVISVNPQFLGMDAEPGPCFQGHMRLSERF
jgi:hypothetical protein